ncbi:beta-ketoacyl synthase N-terminal-like domain-containing protein [Nocardia amamiensis]|uniref:beta-ketoacyl synthase N-terminal-like domain-containing protein n=1 Tax=Nocardia amamiensis TaxID=404578 RepID=UPI000833E890|nr:beta-ketoacyl synthase N-terminal-like domain-containing protein [Nocardia amamiensis]
MKKSKRRTRHQQEERDTPVLAADPIAVVGMSCRFAGGADSPEALWRLLVEETDAVADAPPPGRWSGDYRDPDRSAPGKTVSVAGGYLPDVAGFDAEFFGITPREAADMDPQQRLALELTWEAFEDAGIRPDRVPETGVYFANKFNDYRAVKLARGATAITPFSSTGDVEGVIANRVSYFLGFDGPSMTVNASCAGSLVAVHLACQALRAGESALAVAGGVQLNLIPETAVGLSALGVLSPRGRSRTFDASADGYVRGEGGAVVVLKPLTQALRDGDRVYCTLLGSATNNNGKHRSMPASSADGQRQLLRRACARAGVDPMTIDYVEAHGTGTAIGDRAELSALAEVYGTGRAPDAPLTVGSIKTNIGHTEAAAGMAGLVKVALALSHRRIPSSLHFDHAPGDFDSAAAGLRVADKALPWPQHDGPARAAVSAFGFGGSNAHVVVEAAPHPAPVIASEIPERLVVLSARTEAALRAHARRLRDHLVSQPGIALGDLAHTLATRTPFRHRLAVVAEELDHVVEFLDGYLDGDDDADSDDRENDVLSRVLSAALRPGTVDRRELLAAAGMLFRRGIEPDWAAVNPPGRPIPLPTYPFQRERHWATPQAHADVSGVARPSSPTYSPPAEPTASIGRSTARRSIEHVDRDNESSADYYALVEPGDFAGTPRRAAIEQPGIALNESSSASVAVGSAPAAGTSLERLTVSGEPAETAGPDVAALADVVTGQLAEVVGIAADRVDVRQNFDQLGIGSVHAVELSARLGARLGIDVPAAIFWGCPSVELLAAELGTRLGSAVPAADSVTRPAARAAVVQPIPDEEALSTAELLALSRELLG